LEVGSGFVPVGLTDAVELMDAVDPELVDSDMGMLDEVALKMQMNGVVRFK
jgi:hypothetical protein